MKKPITPPVTELASQIYTGLILQSFEGRGTLPTALSEKKYKDAAMQAFKAASRFYQLKNELEHNTKKTPKPN